ncbi:rhodanese-like domain-containing protein [Bernardetia sp. ABR2-2B]|uniref:rhodanese-like domain-containing protein n=1 Tax=Bernardetia sp. ABR2-2B TaxID=3127472 RepID=UPI0030CC38F2
MKYTFLIIFIFSLLFSCTNKAEQNNSAEESSTQKIEKLIPQDFAVEMTEVGTFNLIDVRTPQEYNQGSISNAKNINFNNSNFEEQLNKLEKDKPIFLYCKSGGRSAKAVEKAKEMGFERIIELEGGIEKWKDSNVETNHNIE